MYTCIQLYVTFSLNLNLSVSRIQPLDGCNVYFYYQICHLTRYLFHLVIIQMLLDIAALGLNCLNSRPS